MKCKGAIGFVMGSVLLIPLSLLAVKSVSLATAVNVTKVIKKNIPITVIAVGSLSAVQVVTVSAETNGRISAIHFKNGQEVAAGMPLIQLDDQQAQADYQSALTTLQLAKQKYTRSSQLLNIAVSQQDLDTLKAAVATAGADVKSKLATLNEKKVTAPFSGVLGSFVVHVGAYVQAGTPLVKLVNTKQLRADYNLAESYKPNLKIDQSVAVKVNAYPKKVFYGTVNYVSPTINTASRTIEIQALVNNAKGLLSPGMFANIQQDIMIQKNALVVPNQAIMADVKGSYIYLVKGDRVQKVYVKVGQRTQGIAQILSGVALGDLIVTAGQQKLEDGSLVSISNS